MNNDSGYLDNIGQVALLLEQAQQRQDQAMAALQHTAQETRSTLTQTVNQAGEQIARHSQDAVKEALAAQLSEFELALATTMKKLSQAADQVNRNCEQATRQMRFMSIKMLVCIGATALLLIGGTGFLVWQNTQRIKETAVQAEVMQAMQQVQMTSCGGKPCIRLDQNQQRWGKNGEYVLIGPTSGQSE